MAENLSLAAKVAKIAEACAYVQKTGNNAFHKYRYATAADVLAKVNEAMVQHNVASTAAVELIEQTTDQGGNRTATVKVRLTLHDGDSEAVLVTEGMGCGQDKGDKAVMKAQTAAIKYAWMLALNISTGDDPEADEDTDKRNHAPASPQRPIAAPPATAPQPAVQPLTPTQSTLEGDEIAQYACVECHQPLKGIRFQKDGTEWSPQELADRGRRQHGKVLCRTHYFAASEAKKAPAHA